MSDPSADMAAGKQKLREKLRFRRRHFVANLDNMARQAAFRALPAPLAELVASHIIVGAYAPWSDEPDLLPVLASCADDDQLALPYHAARDERMEFRRWHTGDSLVQGPWTTPQPSRDKAIVLPTLIFCPLVGFDRSGGRIGQGGGHFDRYFAAHPDALRIGVGWSVQEIDAAPRESTDIALDAILTEQEFIMTGDRS